ncbi:MAG: hypothetical protein RLZZ214_3209 [Verrucomicrobiota bacterium]|jgi:hypothetical protein
MPRRFLVAANFSSRGNHSPQVFDRFVFEMSHEHHPLHEWGRAKQIRQSHGLTAPQLARYADDGLIRTSHIRRPGQTRGVRLYHVGDLDRLIVASIEPTGKNQNNN